MVVHRYTACVLSQFSLCKKPDSSPPYVEPTRLHCPWDSPGKNTRMGCHALLEDLLDPESEPMSLMSPELAGGFFTTSATWEAPEIYDMVICFKIVGVYSSVARIHLCMSLHS